MAPILYPKNPTYTACKHTLSPQYRLKYAFWVDICALYFTVVDTWQEPSGALRKKLCSRSLALAQRLVERQDGVWNS